MSPLDPTQRSLFVDHDPMEPVREALRPLAARLPPTLRMGTSSWAYPAWEGIVYAHGRTENALARDGLREYAKHPLLTTAGVDRTYYGPIADDDLDRLAAQLPDGYRCCFKAPASVTSPIAPGDPRSAPKRNDDFFSPARFEATLGRALREHFLSHTGVIVLEVPRAPAALTPTSEVFCERLAHFLTHAPRCFSYAVELRDRSLFTPRYVKTLRAHDASHVHNWWTHAVPFDVQRRAAAPASMPLTLIRALLPPGGEYEDRRRALEPFNALRAPDPVMRREVVATAREALEAGRPTWILTGNKAEGCAPETVRVLAEMLAR